MKSESSAPNSGDLFSTQGSRVIIPFSPYTFPFFSFVLFHFFAYLLRIMRMMGWWLVVSCVMIVMVGERMVAGQTYISSCGPGLVYFPTVVGEVSTYSPFFAYLFFSHSLLLPPFSLCLLPLQSTQHLTCRPNNLSFQHYVLHPFFRPIWPDLN